MEKKKAKFNFIDVLVILVILAAVGFVGFTVFGGGFGGGEAATYEVTYLCEEVPDFAATIIKEGDKVLDEQKDTDLGVVTDVKLSGSRTYTTTETGDVKIVPKEYYNCVELTTKVDATEYDFGMIVDSCKYGVGHSITIRVGKAKIFGRISGIEKID